MSHLPSSRQMLSYGHECAATSASTRSLISVRRQFPHAAAASPNNTILCSRWVTINNTLDYIAYMTHGIPWLGVLGNRGPDQDESPLRPSRALPSYFGAFVGGWRGGPGCRRIPRTTHRAAGHQNLLRKMPVVDLFICHAPPPSAALDGGLVSPTDYIHRGFDAFDSYLRVPPSRGIGCMVIVIAAAIAAIGWRNQGNGRLCGPFDPGFSRMSPEPAAAVDSESRSGRFWADLLLLRSSRHCGSDR